MWITQQMIDNFKTNEIKINNIIMTELEYDFHNKNWEIINWKYHWFPIKKVTKI